MRSAHFFSSVGGFVFIAGIAGIGCSSSNSSAPTSSDYDDVAQSTAALVATSGGGGELGSMYDTATIAVGVTPGDVTASASGTFNGVHAGVSYTFTVACTNASGATLPACGPTTNDATASVDWSGNLTLPNYTATVNRTGNWTLTGVQTTTATFNGTGSFSFASTFASAFRDEQASTNLTYAASYDAVVYSMAAHYATGGSVHYTINGSGSASSTSGAASGSFSIDALLTFASNGSATLVLDGSHTYLVTAAGTVTKI